MHLHEKCKSKRPTFVRLNLTDEPPRVARIMDLHARGQDIGRVTEERQPHVFNVKVVECLTKSLGRVNTIKLRASLVNRTIELMTLFPKKQSCQIAHSKGCSNGLAVV